MLTLTINKLVVRINLLILQSSLRWIGLTRVGGPRLDKCTKEEWEVLFKYWNKPNFAIKQGHVFNVWAQVQNVNKSNHGGPMQQAACYVNAHWTWHVLLAYKRASWFMNAYINFKLFWTCLGFWRLDANPSTTTNTWRNSYCKHYRSSPYKEQHFNGKSSNDYVEFFFFQAWLAKLLAYVWTINPIKA